MPLKPKWTLAALKAVAADYSRRVDFQRNARGAYLSALRQGFLDDVCEHMARQLKPKGYWTLEMCKAEALKYSARGVFMRQSATAYNISLKNGWLDEVCKHMIKGADGFHYMFYGIINKRLNKVYVGITKQHFNSRAKLHKKGGSTRADVIAKLEDTEYVPLTDYIHTSTELLDAEEGWAKHYETDGFQILNDPRLYGRMGVSKRVYSDEDIAKEASKYTSRSKFKEGSPNHYDAAVSQRILSRVCSHLRGIKSKGYWTKEMCIEEARKSTDRYDFVTNHTEAYTAARNNGWTEEIYLLLGLRSRFDMSWRRPGTRKEIWCDADKYHKLWIESGMCGMDRMKTLTGFNLGKLLKKFKSGWVPTEDADWIDWASKIKLE